MSEIHPYRSNYFGANIQIKIDIQQIICIYLPLDDFKD